VCNATIEDCFKEFESITSLSRISVIANIYRCICIVELSYVSRCYTKQDETNFIYSRLIDFRTLSLPACVVFSRAAGNSEMSVAVFETIFQPLAANVHRPFLALSRIWNALGDTMRKSAFRSSKNSNGAGRAFFRVYISRMLFEKNLFNKTRVFIRSWFEQLC